MSDVNFESNAQVIRDQFKKMTKLAEQEGMAFVNDSMNKIHETIVPLTPIKTGDLRRGYRVVKARKLSTGRIVGAIVNTESYWKYVNDGHRLKNGGFVKGRFMLQKAQNLANMSYIPTRWKVMTIKVLKGAKK
ncbi:HK97 gp10 family phage protein [Enterococcus asini]|uniref:HK97 gp10 family phage protein n=1 Tax=Enterococcus asini TaxID=57732 RepID=UPI0032E4B223